MLSADHLAIRESVRDFVKAEVEPIASHLDNEGAEIPPELIRKMAELGYFGLIFSPDHGGSGLDTLSMALVTEELSRAWLSVGSVMTRMLITGTLIEANGTEEQKRRWLPRISSGEVLAAAAFTEPSAGSDAAAVQTRADKRAGGYTLTGEKAWCTFANRAHVLCTLVRTNPKEPRHKGLSILLVPKPGDAFDPPRLSGDPIPTIGYKGMNSYNVAFDGYEVPEENLLGLEEGKGFYQLMATYEYARIQTAARAVGVAQAALDAAVQYAQEREQFGKPIASFQAIRHKIAKVRTEIEAARQLTYHACRMKDTGARCDLEAGMAKAFAAEMAEQATSECLQIFGGYGYSKEFPAQRYWRDARVFRIFEGTSEIQYEVIAKRVLNERS